MTLEKTRLNVNECFDLFQFSTKLINLSRKSHRKCTKQYNNFEMNLADSQNGLLFVNFNQDYGK